MTHLRLWMVMVFLPAVTTVSFAGVTVVGALTDEREIAAGTSYTGIVQIRNNGEKREEVKIYQTDYSFSADGQSVYGPPGEAPRSNAGWVDFTPKQPSIPPGVTITVNYTVTVPNDDRLTGTYWSVLMVEGVGTADEPPPRPGELRILSVFRYGVQIITTIRETGIRKLAFAGMKLLREKGHELLQADVGNTGEVMLRVTLRVELYTEDGKHVSSADAGERKRTFPGTSIRFNVDLGTLSTGKYKALVIMDGGGDDLFGAVYDLEVSA